MNFVLFMNCALLALFSTTSLVSSGEDDYDPCKAGWFLVNFVSSDCITIIIIIELWKRIRKYIVSIYQDVSIIKSKVDFGLNFRPQRGRRISVVDHGREIRFIVFTLRNIFCFKNSVMLVLACL